jgi:hypothetical protein
MRLIQFPISVTVAVEELQARLSVRQCLRALGYMLVVLAFVLMSFAVLVGILVLIAMTAQGQVQSAEPNYKTQPMVERIPYCNEGWKLQQYDCGNMGACGYMFGIHAEIPEHMGGWFDVPAGTGRGMGPGPHQGDYRCVPDHAATEFIGGEVYDGKGSEFPVGHENNRVAFDGQEYIFKSGHWHTFTRVVAPNTTPMYACPYGQHYHPMPLDVIPSDLEMWQHPDVETQKTLPVLDGRCHSGDFDESLSARGKRIK